MKGLEFDAEKHEYFLNGVKMMSVSDILQPLTASMYSGIDPLTLANAARRGTRIHELCELMDYDALPDEFEAELLPYVSAYRTFKRDYGVKEWRAVEMQVACPHLGLAGTIDREGEIDGNFCLVDIKTGASVAKKRLAVQITAYTRIIHSNIHDLYGLHLKKDGSYHFSRVKRQNKVFEACLDIAKYLRRR